jgi:hypothetical protein
MRNGEQSGDGGAPGDGEGAEIDRLARVAKEVNSVDAVYALQGALVEFFDRERRAYMEQAGDAWTDAGLAAWIKEREGEVQAAWAADLADLQGG